MVVFVTKFLFCPGLQLILNVQQMEYLGLITAKAGFRVVVHNQTQLPYPEINGIDIGPGLATAVGIKKVG